MGNGGLLNYFTEIFIYGLFNDASNSSDYIPRMVG
jgi:hypothetical protein